VTDTQSAEASRVSASAHRPMIVAENAHVTYKVYSSGKPVGARSKMFGQRGGTINEVHAVRGVSFTASEGETIGVVGHNGSGKSTLFRALSGLIPTSEGQIWAADRPVLLGVNAALMPELSGESNIKLGLLAMGYSAEDAAAQVDEIADFAELNEFISHPMRTYSSGMGARLRFAIASARPHSILLLDEALAVGDRRFRQKSEERIRELRDAAGLVMIVSHSAGSLKDTCDRALWIHKGELRADGAAKEVVDEYTKWTKDPSSVAVGAAAKPKPKPPVPAADLAPRSSGSTAGVTVGERESPRDKARRERFLSATRQKKRRKLIAATVTGGAIVAAVGAGAAIALVSSQADRSELTELRAVVSASPSPTPSATPILPVIGNFAANAPSVFCETVDSTAEAQLAWDVNGAARLSIAGPPSEGNPAGTPVLTDLGPVTPAQGVPFICANETQTYTLVAENASGQQVSSTVTVARELPPEPEIVEPEQPVTEQPEQPQPEEPVVPEPTPTDPQPTPTAPEPTPEPTEPTTAPTDGPTAEPTDTPPTAGTTGDGP
jgi:ABC-type polysaccharide/polyol phosphate transport system ATPase subunit